MNHADSSRTRTNRQGHRSMEAGQIYIDGSTARKLQTAPAYKSENKGQRDARRQQAARQHRAAKMNLGYICFMMLATCVVCIVLIGYVNLQADITNRINHISRLESQLNNMRLANDEEYTKIMSNVDLEEIKRIAINELGMKYAKEGQVITYSGEGNDYVRQYKEIPNSK